MRSYFVLDNEFTSLNDIVYYYSGVFEGIDTKQSSRNDDSMGKVKELINESIVLQYPRNRNLYLYGRKNNPFATWAETLWVLGGDEYLNPVMTAFLPRCTDFSDDGKTWRGAYNTRLKRNSSLEHIIQMYREDGINTRRACCSIWRPDMDTDAVISQTLGTKTKDMPCSNFIWTWIRDNKFNLKLGMRSNDLVWGLSNINVFEFTVIQELLYEYLKRDLGYHDLKLGSYIHNPVSLHVYERTYPQIHNIANDVENTKLTELENDEDNYTIKIPKILSLTGFCGQMYSNFEYCVREILSESMNGDGVLSQAEEFFHGVQCETNGNMMYYYFILPLLYLVYGKLKTIPDLDNFLDFITKKSINLSIDISRMLEVRYQQ